MQVERRKLRESVTSSPGVDMSSTAGVFVRESVVDGDTFQSAVHPVPSVDTTVPNTGVPVRKPRPTWKMSLSSEDDVDTDGDDIVDPSTDEEGSSIESGDDGPEVPKPIKVRGRADTQHKAILDGRELLEDTFATAESLWLGGCTVWDRQKNEICEAPAMFRCVVFVSFVFFVMIVIVLCVHMWTCIFVFYVGVVNVNRGPTCVPTVFVYTTLCVCTTSTSGMRRTECTRNTSPPGGTVFSCLLAHVVFRLSKPLQGGGKMSTSGGIFLCPIFLGEGFFHLIPKGLHVVFLVPFLICVPVSHKSGPFRRPICNESLRVGSPLITTFSTRPSYSTVSSRGN